ncbi:restriction endonuclease subunit S [Enterobacter hormaechei]|uniref:restriction endonuclease subunit S n=1 Tax=Enterobacter hormaechei TaxID=158836 RepID=UPI00107A3C53|nr:restriction endonuclease subunit S [Enterobacter hormaechei]EAA7634061.1 restriction endonuclease subunit S [Salmonella enterica]EBQ4931323.1 restriction endonuclease subunit S [Salmonella enterica]MBF1961809.1 restriction endonuclease subunit S [Enterobacter hormaechei]MBF1980035.1 restriction endonuclease subunit S [Enterobacter hormaechei]
MPTPLKKLGQIAGIRSGHTLRGAITPDPEGDVHLLQIKDLDQDWQFNHKALPTVVWEQRIAPPFLEQGEIVVAARGNRNLAVVYRGQVPVVPTSQFLIVSLKRKESEIAPEYVCWLLNHPTIQQWFHRSGTNIQLITKSALLDVIIPVPSLEIQLKVIELQRAWQEEALLISKLQKNRHDIELGILQKLLKD